MRIKVEQRHIDASNGSCFGCPVALALVEAFPGSRVSVWPEGVAYIRLDHFQPERHVYLGPETTRWIERYDNSEPVEPFEFDLPDVDQAV